MLLYWNNVGMSFASSAIRRNDGTERHKSRHFHELVCAVLIADKIRGPSARQLEYLSSA